MAQTNPNGPSQCGPDHGVCNRNLHVDSLYCHATHKGGECGAGDNYRGETTGDEYDWGYCPGKFCMMKMKNKGVVKKYKETNSYTTF